MEHPRFSKIDAMSSIEARIQSNSTGHVPTEEEEYESLGHDAFFEKYKRFQGLTKEQLEVRNKNFDQSTLRNLYSQDSNSIDNF